MRCAQCEADLPVGANFCINCGAHISGSPVVSDVQMIQAIFDGTTEHLKLTEAPIWRVPLGALYVRRSGGIWFKLSDTLHTRTRFDRSGMSTALSEESDGPTEPFNSDEVVELYEF